MLRNCSLSGKMSPGNYFYFCIQSMALVSNIGIYIGIYNNMMPHDSNITLGWVGGGKSDFMISGKLVVICKGKGICAADCWYLYPRQVAPAAQQQQQQQSAEQNHFSSREHLQCWACSLLTNVNIRQIRIQIQIQIQKESLLLQSICSGPASYFLQM